MQLHTLFFELKIIKVKMNTISRPADLIKGSERALILLASETRLCIHNALYFSRSSRNLLNVKDIHLNGYHIET